MVPLGLLAAQKVGLLLTADNALGQELNTLTASANVSLPPIQPNQIVLTAVGPEIADKNAQLTYPRICLYSTTIKNTHLEKFRSLSGSLSVSADVWASANLLQDVDQWIQFYVEATTAVLRLNTGDWGDGIFFSGAYDVQFQAPKAGGFGYVELGKVTCTLSVSRN